MNKLLQTAIFITFCLILLLAQPTRADQLRIELFEGNNLVSMNLRLDGEFYEDDEDGPDLPRMWEQLEDEDGNHRVLLIKSDNGRMYAPAFGFNNIPYWDVTGAYQVLVSEDCVVIWDGEPVDPQMDIHLRSGWNLIAYLPNYPLSAGAPDFHIFSPLLDDLDRVSNTYGEYLIPEYNFSNMRPGTPGTSYFIRVSDEVVFNYPDEGDGELFYPWVGDHWETPRPTADRMGIRISDISGVEPDSGDQVAAIDADGIIVGVGVVQVTACALTVWGADQDDGFGLQNGEAFVLRYWDDSEGVELEVEVERFVEGNGLHYQEDFLVIEIETGLGIDDGSGAAVEHTLASIHPNPFNAVTNIRFALEKASHVTLSIYDLDGRAVATIADEPMITGEHEFAWNGMSNPSGMYLFRLTVDGKTSVTRGVLLR